MINATERKPISAGMTLVARYKGEQHECTVVEGEEGRLRYRLADGREFKSASAAGSAVMGGVASNGWHFWSLAGEEPDSEMAAEAEATGEPRQPGGSRKHACEVCGKSFMSAKWLEHHLANADRLCTAA